jgi:hypothetical protein
MQEPVIDRASRKGFARTSRALWALAESLLLRKIGIAYSAVQVIAISLLSSTPAHLVLKGIETYSMPSSSKLFLP